ncbi:hypothetical protein ACFLT2_11660 [Acidobacteriota bacterium]
MGLTLSDYIFGLLIVGLLIIILILYRKNKQSLRSNIREILDEYKDLKEITAKLRRDADVVIARTEEADGAHENLKTESDKLREALFDVRQKSKSDIEYAINAMKKELKGELNKELDKLTPKLQPQKEIKKTKELNLNDEHINVLHQLASLREEISLTVLYEHYLGLFPNRERKDFQGVIRELTENNLIREAFAEAGDFYYTISNEGIVHLQNRMT